MFDKDTPFEIIFNAPWEIADVTIDGASIPIIRIHDPRFGHRCYALSEQSLTQLSTWILKRGTQH